MKQYTEFIMKHRKWIIGIFLVLTLICGLLSKLVGVNYDFADYLPEDAKSTKAIDVMLEEYNQSIPNMRVLLYDVSIVKALEYKNAIEEVEGVEEVQWLDDVINIYQPLETINKDIVNTWYKEQSAIFSVTINEENQLDTVNAIRDIIGDENCMSGSAVSNAVAPVNTDKEVKRIMLIVLPIILVILLLTTTSWYEPFLFLATIGIAVMLNRGTNLMFGTISFVTNAAGGVLQLAVSMDYSIFLLHRFSDNRREGMAIEEAMKHAIRQATGSILSSGLTTVTGFAALILMRFRIGPDMGFVMAKAIVLSLITVLCLLPVLAVATYKLIDKTEHKPLYPSFDRLSKVIYKIKIPVLAIFIILMVPCFLASRNNEFLYGSSKVYSTEETQLGRDLNAINELYGNTNQIVVMVKRGEYSKEVALNKAFLEMDDVTSVISYSNTVGESVPEEFVPSSKLSQLYSENYSRFVLSLDTEEGLEGCFELIDRIRDVTEYYYGDEYHLAGDLVSTEDLKQTITADERKVNFLAIAFVFLILMFSFKSITIPIILTLVIETSIWINLAVPYFGSDTLYYIGYLIVSSVQLGATIDYAILLTERYKEKRVEHAKKEAIIEALKSCMISIITSASILACAGTVLGIISTNGVLSQLGTLLGRGAVLSFVLVVFVLPLLLAMFDKLIGYTTIGWRRDSKGGKSHE
ncbi:efflux RND transporter permease subunit [Anaerosporobacter sp.]|uniref:efflux RND transporter permease subunit n=1 Tax=Anaerosporobacter sp. TaxID=1872529 RepID=UPI00286EFA97|nr:MMPL family transporter [Anaerosporobacter sp.]